MEDYLKNIKAALYERVTNPLFGTFALSWSVSNWKIIYVSLFVGYESIKPLNKLDYLLSFYPWSCSFTEPYDFLFFWTLSKLVFIPAFVTAAFIWWPIPILVKKAYKIHITYKTEKFKVEKENETPVSPQDLLEVIESYEKKLKPFTTLVKEKAAWLKEKETLEET